MSSTHPRPDRQSRALVVHDSVFESSAGIADAVARGLAAGGIDAISLDVTRAPEVDSLQVDLLVIGVSAYSLRPTGSRDRASIREWLARSTSRTARTPVAAVYDIQVRPARRLLWSAPTRESHALEALGFLLLGLPEHFAVEGLSGPLADGETERAVGWGRQLSCACLSQEALSR